MFVVVVGVGVGEGLGRLGGLKGWKGREEEGEEEVRPALGRRSGGSRRAGKGRFHDRERVSDGEECAKRRLGLRNDCRGWGCGICASRPGWGAGRLLA